MDTFITLYPPPYHLLLNLLTPSNHSPQLSSHLTLSDSVFDLFLIMAKFWVCFLWVMLAGNLVSGQGDDDQFSPGGARREMVPAMFVFGDSLIDNGNNNNLPSFAKANYFPYGIDFEGGPTGRFSNGYTMVDEIGANSLSLCIYSR